MPARLGQWRGAERESAEKRVSAAPVRGGGVHVVLPEGAAAAAAWQRGDASAPHRGFLVCCPRGARPGGCSAAAPPPCGRSALRASFYNVL